MINPPSMFEQVRKELTRSRGPDEANLVEEVRKALREAGLSKKIDIFNSHPDIIPIEDKTPEIQRVWLNRYWCLQMLSSPADSEEPRFCLTPIGDLAIWLDLFKRSVIPFLLENDLPRQL